MSPCRHTWKELNLKKNLYFHLKVIWSYKQNLCRKETILYSSKDCSSRVFLLLCALCLHILPVSSCVCQCKIGVAIGWSPNQMVCQCKSLPDLESRKGLTTQAVVAATVFCSSHQRTIFYQIHISMNY